MPTYNSYQEFLNIPRQLSAHKIVTMNIIDKIPIVANSKSKNVITKKKNNNRRIYYRTFNIKNTLPAGV